MNKRASLIGVLGAVSALALMTAEVHSGVLITPSAGYLVTYDGNDGDYFNPADPAVVPNNLALQSGADYFGSSEYPSSSSHSKAHINDGKYGNKYSWLADLSTIVDPSPYIGVKFDTARAISGIAWSRDNGNNVTESGNTSVYGQYGDRSLYEYTLQYTRVADPEAVTADDADPTLGWATIGTFDYQSDDDTVVGGGFTSFFRHEYGLAKDGRPITATGVRIKPSSNEVCIDEIELYAPVPDQGLTTWLDSAGGVETSGSDVTVWRDQSGNGNDATPGSATAPTLTGTMSGQAVVHFNGTDDQRLNLPSANTSRPGEQRLRGRSSWRSQDPGPPSSSPPAIR